MNAIISGNGTWTYEYLPQKLQLPNGAHVIDAHGWALDEDKNIYLTYHPNIYMGDKNCLIKWKPDGTEPEFLPVQDVCEGTPHGLRLAKEYGETFLYHANN